MPDLYNAGLSSLKIEGRMKSIHYVATVTKVYREALDAYEADPEHFTVRQEWLDELEKISHRPYTRGFSVSRPTEADQVYSESSNTQTHDFIGLVRSYDTEKGIAGSNSGTTSKSARPSNFCSRKAIWSAARFRPSSVKKGKPSTPPAIPVSSWVWPFRKPLNPIP